MSLRGWLKRLEREASEDAVLIRGRDGSIRAFDRMHVMAEMYLARLDAALGEPPRPSDVMDALEGATPESRRAVEEIGSGGAFFDLKPRDPDAPPLEDLSEQATEH